MVREPLLKDLKIVYNILIFKYFYFYPVPDQHVNLFVKEIVKVCELHIDDKYVALEALCSIYSLEENMPTQPSSICNGKFAKRISAIIIEALERYYHDGALLQNAILVMWFCDFSYFVRKYLVYVFGYSFLLIIVLF